LFGNAVSHSERHTRRTWKPNVIRKRLYSEALGTWLKLRLTTKALRCIDRVRLSLPLLAHSAMANVLSGPLPARPVIENRGFPLFAM
jgi:ribosomal protein L28